MFARIPAHFPNIELATHVVMPNHVHGIIVIRQKSSRREAGDHGESPAKDLISPARLAIELGALPRRAQHAVPLPTHRFGATVAGSIPAVVGAFKSASAKQVRQVMRRPQLRVW